MTLGFTTIMHDGPNFFVEKIWQSLLETYGDRDLANEYSKFLFKYKQVFGKEWDIELEKELFPKHHTVRRAKSKRWKAGHDIHFVVNNRTAARFQFAPVIKCVSVQVIDLIPPDKALNIKGSIKIDGRELDLRTGDLFARNDGFENLEALYTYFGKPFSGQLVHWTPMKY